MRDHGISRVVAGYAWEWKINPRLKPDKPVFDINIQGYSYKWNSTQKDWVNSSNSLKEIYMCVILH